MERLNFLDDIENFINKYNEIISSILNNKDIIIRKNCIKCNGLINIYAEINNTTKSTEKVIFYITCSKKLSRDNFGILYNTTKYTIRNMINGKLPIHGFNNNDRDKYKLIYSLKFKNISIIKRLEEYEKYGRYYKKYIFLFNRLKEI